MQIFDASSMIYAWDNYPINQFPGLWKWMGQKIHINQLSMPCVAFDEVDHKTPDCSAWLNNNNLNQLEIDNKILQKAKNIKVLLGIANDDYHPKGVGENDILIIATAFIYNAELVSDEEQQPTPPKSPAKSKIPTVCKMSPISVPCINFIGYIRKSGAVF